MRLWMKSLSVSIKMKAITQYFPTMIQILLTGLDYFVEH